MTYYVAGIPYSSNDIYHHGIKGQRWGIRRTAQQLGHQVGQRIQNGVDSVKNNVKQKMSETGNRIKNADLKTKIKTGVKVGAALAAAGLAIYGAKKLNDFVNDQNRQYLDIINLTESRNIANAKSKALRSNNFKHLFGLLNSSKHSANASKINEATKRAYATLDAELERQRKSGFINKAKNAAALNRMRKDGTLERLL